MNFAKPRRASLTENHRTTASGNDPRQSLVFSRSLSKMQLFKSDAGYILILAIFLQKTPQKVIASHNLIIFGGIFLKYCTAGPEEDKMNITNTSHILSLQNRCQSVCFIVPWQENKKMKMLNFTLATFFLFFTLQLLPFPEAALPCCSVVKLFLD